MASKNGKNAKVADAEPEFGDFFASEGLGVGSTPLRILDPRRGVYKGNLAGMPADTTPEAFVELIAGQPEPISMKAPKKVYSSRITNGGERNDYNPEKLAGKVERLLGLGEKESAAGTTVAVPDAVRDRAGAGAPQ